MKGDKVERNGKKYLHMRKMKTKLDVGDVSIHLTNLFNGDPILGKFKFKFGCKSTSQVSMSYFLQPLIFLKN